MLVHFVVFYLKSGLTAEQRADFKAGLESLGRIPALKGFHLGTPAGTTPRPVIDASYDFAITCLLADVAAHDAYQVDPIHTAFVERFKSFWTRVQIYDAA